MTDLEMNDSFGDMNVKYKSIRSNGSTQFRSNWVDQDKKEKVQNNYDWDDY